MIKLSSFLLLTLPLLILSSCGKKTDDPTAATSSQTVPTGQTAPTGKIDVSYNCDGAPIINHTLGTYTYSFLIHTNDAYDDKLKKYICFITPDKMAFYKIDLQNSSNKDGKTFSASFTYAPVSVRSIIYNGVLSKTPYYHTYDIKDLLTSTESITSIEDDQYTPTGVYNFLIVVENKNGQLIASKQVSFPKPFFDISSCGDIDPGPLVNLYSVEF